MFLDLKKTQIIKKHSICFLRSHEQEDDLSKLKDDMRSLQRKVRRLERMVEDIQRAGSTKTVAVSSPVPRASESSSFVETQTAKSLTQSGLTEQDLREKVKIYGVGSKQEALKFAAKAIFTEEELIMSSVTGKKTGKSGATPRPPLDAEKLSLLKRIIQEIDPCIQQRYVTEGIQSIQKVLRVKQKSKQN